VRDPHGGLMCNARQVAIDQVDPHRHSFSGTPGALPIPVVLSVPPLRGVQLLWVY